MKFLLDTHLLLWSAYHPDRLPSAAVDLLQDPEADLVFSAVSIWEAAIKQGLGREDFQTDARLFRRGLLSRGYEELAVSGEHALALVAMPHLHKDPFDRMLVAQAIVEGLVLVTADRMLARYPGPIRRV